MHKITYNISWAWLEGRALEINNTRTDGHDIWLHNTRIATKTEIDNGVHLWATLANYPSRTTLARVNGLCEILKTKNRFRGNSTSGWLYGPLEITTYQWVRIDGGRNIPRLIKRLKKL